MPVSVPAGNPRASTSSASARFGVPTSPATAVAADPSGEERAEAGPVASGVPSLARIGARSGARVRRWSCSPGTRPGKTRFGDHAIDPSESGSTRSPPTSPKAWVLKRIGTTAASSPSGVFPLWTSPTLRSEAVIVRSALSYASLNFANG